MASEDRSAACACRHVAGSDELGQPDPDCDECEGSGEPWPARSAAIKHGLPLSQRRPDAPVRLCCGQRHYGALCPDGKVMCCLCFGRFDVADLSETVDGDKQDVCLECYENENERRAASATQSQFPDADIEGVELSDWRIQVVRADEVSETRFWQRRIRRRKTRTAITVLSTFSPRNLKFTQRLNGGSEIEFEAGRYEDDFSELSALPLPPERPAW